MEFPGKGYFWVRKPDLCEVSADEVTIVTQPGTDLWQRTYYGFRNDNAPVLQIKTAEKYFSFSVKASFVGKRRFDQCGIALYLGSDDWLKASIEYENGEYARLGSVVTNGGWSDWATTDISADRTSCMYYRLSRRENDYLIECAEDGEKFRQMRICHMHAGGGEISFGVYACSPEDSSFTARFTEFKITDCKWQPHK